MARRITEVTRRDVRELLSSLNLWGRLDEIEFLDRLYDLDALPSYDNRFTTARRDIAQHRLANNDWDDDWIFHDDRFGLKDGDDVTLLSFLAQLLHPVVRSDTEEIDNILRQLNDLLEPDGYRLEPKEYLSGRPIFGPAEVPPGKLRPRTTPKHFTEDVRPLVATVSRLAELDGSGLEQAVLKAADPRLEEPEFDRWDGGTWYYTLTLVVPVDLFAKLGDQVRAVEERIADRIKAVLRTPDQHHVTAVVIQPSLMAQSSERLAEVVAERSDRPIPQFWAPGQFRLFISHVTSFKQRATALRRSLSKYHISGFVAHETIEPGELWQKEIEAALRSMHAMVALITPDYHQSNWTDQEVGWALGSNMYVLPVRRGADPYGFIGEVQGVQGLGKTVPQVATEIYETLLRVPSTQGSLLDALVTGFEQSGSFREARDNIGLLEQVGSLPEFLMRRVEVATTSNAQVSQAGGVPERVKRLRRRVAGTL